MAWATSGYRRESVELFEFGNDGIAELRAIRRDPVSGDIYDLVVDDIALGGIYFSSDAEAIEWARDTVARLVG